MYLCLYISSYKMPKGRDVNIDRTSICSISVPQAEHALAADAGDLLV